MATINDIAYYEDETKWGEATHVSLKNIIDNIMITADDDSYFKNVPQHVLEIYGKMAIKEFNIDILSKNKAISISVPPNLIFPFPRFMTDWYRVSVLNECNSLTPLRINNSPTIHDYLQDNEAELLYDDEGNVLQGNSFNAELGHCSIQVDCLDIVTNCPDSKNYTDSFVKENIEDGYFEFSPDLEDKIVVIEFVTAGLEQANACDIRVHHNMERAVEYYIKFHSLQGKRNVPINEVIFTQRLMNKYFKRANRLLGKKISKQEILNIVSSRYSGL